MEDIALREALPQDDSFLFSVYISSREDLSYISGIDDKMREELFKQQYRWQQVQLKERYTKVKLQIICYKGQPVGRFDIGYEGDRWHIMAIALLPAFRNRGIGSYLLLTVLEEASNAHKNVLLQVAWYNASARRLYEKMGFKVIRDMQVYCEMQWQPRKLIEEKEC